MRPRSREAPHLDLLVADGRIAEIGPPGFPAPDGAELVDASDRLLLPGLVNAHTHAHGALAKGLAGDRWPLELLLNANPAFNRDRTLPDKRLSATLNAVELLRRGTTTAFDMAAEFPIPSPEGIHAVASAYEEAGMRAVVAPMVADRTLYEAIPGLLEALPEPLRAEVAAIRSAPCDASLAACRAAFAAWPAGDLVRPGLAPTIPLHCSDDFLRACRDLSDEFGLPLQTHLAESRTQALAAQDRYGCSLVRHLDRISFLSPRLSVAHAIWLEAGDAERLAAAGVSVVHNPMSNARIGSGMADIRTYRDAGLTIGIGTDATNTSDGNNMFEATRWAAYFSRLLHAEYSRWIGPDEAFEMATIGSAAAIGLGDTVGRLEPGYAADILFLDLAHITYVPLGDVLRQLVFAESGAALRAVLIAGRTVLWEGRLLTVDEADLRARATEAAERLAEAGRAAPALSERLEDFVGAFCVGQSKAYRCGCG